MNLVIDVGNTYTKLALFKANKRHVKKVFKTVNLIKEIKLIHKKNNAINKTIISSVGKLSKTQVNFLKRNFNTLILDYKTKLPFKNLYTTPKTLGIDRIALASAAINQFPNSNVLIIDAGTCITYDFINFKNEYLGGAISPGIQMRYKTVHQLTANLPLLKPKVPADLVGNSTKNAIHSGIIFGVLKEIDGVIDAYKQKHSDLTVILTGGDTIFLSKQLKSSIFANSDFLLEGLNFILKFNSNE